MSNFQRIGDNWNIEGSLFANELTATVISAATYLNLPASTATLNEVLINGNTTDGNDIIFNSTASTITNDGGVLHFQPKTSTNKMQFIDGSNSGNYLLFGGASIIINNKPSTDEQLRVRVDSGVVENSYVDSFAGVENSLNIDNTQLTFYSTDGVDENSLLFAPLSVILTSTSGKGFEYAADYSGTFTNRSLVDKAYVDANSGSFTGGTVAGETTFQSQIILPSYTGGTVSANTFTFNCNTGISQKLDLQAATSTTTISITNPKEGNTYILVVTQGSGAYNATLPAGWWLNDTAPYDFSLLTNDERVMVTITYLGGEYHYAVKKLTYA